MTCWSEQRQAGFRTRYQKFNPALGLREGLVGSDLESQFLGIELQRNVLIANRNAHELDSTNHYCLLGEHNLWPEKSQSASRCYIICWYSDDLFRRIRDRRADARSGGTRSAASQFSGISVARG